MDHHDDEGVLLPVVRDFTGDELEEMGLEPPTEDVIIVGGPNRDRIEAGIRSVFGAQGAGPRGGPTVVETRMLQSLAALDRRITFWAWTNGFVLIFVMVLAYALLLA